VTKNSNPDYMVDVARDRIFVNQSKAYHDEYAEWRNNPKNSRYAYSFRHDSREHVYIDGSGYADESVRDSEKEALHRCIQFVGLAMLIFYFMQAVIYFVMDKFFDGASMGWVFYSERHAVTTTSPLHAYVFCIMKVLSYVLTIAFCAFKLRLPLKVAVPNEKPRTKIFCYEMCFSLMFLVISRVFDYVLVNVFAHLKIDVAFYYFMDTGEFTSQLFYFLTEMLVIPILAELLFRGFLLQLLRQFGDSFAIIVAAAASSYIYNDVTKIMFMFGQSIILGVITVRTGSVRSSILARVTTAAVSYLLSLLSIQSGNSAARFWEVALSMAIILISCATAIYLRDHIARPLSLGKDDTEFSLLDKLIMSLNSNLFIVWILISFVSSILWVRFI
jgi:hypothetical protein